jgi:transposase
MDKLFEVSAGLDVHRDTVVASVRRSLRARETVETKTFGTFHDDLCALSDWLRTQQVDVVAMESTGVYFKPVLRTVQHHVQKPIWLVNATAVKQVPGRKSDVNDSAWLSKLVMHGLVRPSFVPDEAQEGLRMLTRHRRKRVGEQRSCKNRIVKQLEACGIKLASVCSDVLGKSGRLMIQALLDGTKSAEEIADLAHGRLRAKRSQLIRAVAGDLTSAVRWLLVRLLKQLQEIERDVDELNDEISRRLAAHADDVALLKQIPGLDDVSIATVVAEVGTDMSVFGSAKRLASWAGLAPGSNESAGKKRPTPTRPGNQWLRTMLVQVAQTVANKWRSRSPWRSTFVRIARNTGVAHKAVFAVARKLCVTIFHVLQSRAYTPFVPPPETEAARDRAKQRALEQLRALGYVVELSGHIPLEEGPTRA